jgi:phosphoserine phosphatase
MRIILVRHGESEWNRLGIYQGQEDAPLSDLGLRQAEALANRLQHETIHAIYTSPLQRARRTAEAIARHHLNVPFVEDEAIMEIHHGLWQGLPATEVRERYPELLEEWRRYPTRIQMPGGESFSNILKRVLNFRERVCAGHDDDTILFSTHDVVIKILIADVLGMPMDRINNIWVTNASISVIEYTDSAPFLVSLSEACHLGQLETVREKQLAV